MHYPQACLQLEYISMSTDCQKSAGHPLGPLFSYVPMDHPFFSRIYAAGLTLAASALLLTAYQLSPNGKEMGTHQQLKLPPCGFLVITGFPCPTCGMTTAYAYTVRGQFIHAMRAQFAGFIMALATSLVGLLSFAGLLTGRRLDVNWYRINPTHAVWWMGALLVLSWAAKIIIGLLDGSLPAR